MNIADFNPIDAPLVWDFVFVAGQSSPGLVTVSGFGIPNKIDVKDAAGAQGATTTYRGNSPAKGKLVFRLWTPEHFAAWDSFERLFRIDATKKTVQAVDIFHPALAKLDISHVIPENVGQLERSTDGDTAYTVTIDLIEYKPPKKKNVTKTPNSSVDKFGNLNDTPFDREQNRQLAENTKTIGASEPLFP